MPAFDNCRVDQANVLRDERCIYVLGQCIRRIFSSLQFMHDNFSSHYPILHPQLAHFDVSHFASALPSGDADGGAGVRVDADWL